ncbi:hypothetical protein DFH11DRAFT_752519 [Phellopilus nigrolimitatus]|nr:hypothetical protein DFH11DRAFT_752519 [Phellopilus nigrolimitatus]
MILLSELSRRRIRSIQKLIRVGHNKVVVVMRVDKEMGGCAAIAICHLCIYFAFLTSSLTTRLHRPLEEACLARGHYQTRGALHEVQDSRPSCGTSHRSFRRRNSWRTQWRRQVWLRVRKRRKSRGSGGQQQGSPLGVPVRPNRVAAGEAVRAPVQCLQARADVRLPSFETRPLTLTHTSQGARKVFASLTPEPSGATFAQLTATIARR